MRDARSVAFFIALSLAGSLHVLVRAQTVGQNVNIVTGSADEFVGDLFRQRQTEPVLGISSVNPSHMMAAYVDYRTVDSVRDPGSVVPPSLPQGFVAKLLDFLRAPWQREPRGPITPVLAIAPAQAWIGLSFSDNGEDWYTGLLPGHPSGLLAEDFASPLTAYEAASDPVLATMPDKFLLGGIAFTPNGSSAGFVARFADRNDTETERNIQYEWTKVLVTQPQGFFVDKPSIAAGPGGRVYAAFVIFDQSDPKRLSSKIQVYRSANSGETWSGPVTVSEPLTRNQAPWIVVDPNNENTLYIGWRVFAARTGGIANAIVGKKSTNGGQSFTPIVPYPVALLLKAFDQPQGRLPASLPIPRSNAYPTAAIDGNGGIHVALQEYVYPPNYPTVGLRGLPLGPNVSPTVGVPRITVTSSYTGGLQWTPRKAIDFGAGTGTQFVPVLTAVGEPGSSCAGSSGPRSRIMLMYYDARAGGAGTAPGSTGYVAGGATQFDVRIAQASACNRDGLGRLIFSASELVSQYTRSAEPPHDIVTTPPYDVTAVNRAYPMFCGGNCAFAGDYLYLSPRVPYVQTANGWRPTTANAVDKNKLPAPVVQGLWSDMRDVLLPTTGALRTGLPPGASMIDALPWDVYQQPGTGLAPCVNPGSRDGNIYMARYTPGLLFAAAPETFRVSDIPRAYPVYVENRAGQQRFFRLTIDASANASFDFQSFDMSPSAPPRDREAEVAIGPYSSVTGSVILGPGVNQSVLVTVEEIGVDQNGLPVAIPNAAKTTVTLFTTGQMATTGTETRTPAVSPTPEITFPFAGRLPITVSPATPFSQNPFVHNPFSQNPFSQNPFSQNPFSQNPFSQNPFSQNPFSQNPFAQDETIYEVTDISFRVTNNGSFDAAFTALLNVQNALELTGSYFFQVIINRASPAPTMYFDQLGNCQAFDGAQPIQVSSIVTPFSQNPFSQNPFSQNPFSQNPFSQNPFSQNPFSQNPFSQNPFSQNPFSQNTDPRDPAVSNSSFYIAPQTFELPPTPEFRAKRPPDEIIYTLRAYQIRANNDPALVPLIPPGETQPPVGVVVVADTPGFIELPGGGTGFDPDGVSASSGGSALPVQLAFVQQPTSTVPGAIITPPIQVAIQDGSGILLPGSTVLVTLAIGANPGGGTLVGTTTRDDDDDGSVDGLVTFPGLSINNTGVGYTLVASSVGLTETTSTPFDITTAMCTPEPAGLVSWWPGNGNANDIRGSNNGTLQGAVTFAPGTVGQAFNLSGVNQYVDIVDSGTLNPASAFTIDGWFYIDPNAAGNAGELSTLASKSTGGSADGGWFLIFDDGQMGFTTHVKALRFAVFDAAGVGAEAVAENVVTTAGWYHVAGTFDSSLPQQSNLYVNGALVASSAVTIASMAPNAVTMRIGAMHQDELVGTTTYGSDRLNGLADEVHFFDRALTLAEVQAIYNANGQGLCVGPTFVVTNLNDGGAGSLRQAMTSANAVLGTAPPTITFNIPLLGTYTITPFGTPLPTMTRSVIIDGRTQPGYAGAPVIVIAGAFAGMGANGLTLTGGSSQVRGLAIGGFGGSGIVLQTGGENRIAGNYLGTNLAGTAPFDIGDDVILIQDSANNLVGGLSGTTPGGPCTGDCNVIVARGAANGVNIVGNGVTSGGNRVLGNFIGTNAAGGAGLGGPTSFGVGVSNALGAIIGDGTAAGRNLISGNNTGVFVAASSTSIKGNYIGTNAAGTAAVGNLFGGFNNINFGVQVTGGDHLIEGNLLSGNGTGLSFVSQTTIARGNIIGLNAAGTAAIPNSWGVLFANGGANNVLGGMTAADRNVISGNSQHGVVVGPGGAVTGNRVMGNYIGTNPAGNAAIPNGSDGVIIDGAPGNIVGGSLPGEGNVISGNGGSGVFVRRPNGEPIVTGTVIQGNIIGLDASGSVALGNADGIRTFNAGAQIGGTTPGARNIISANNNGISLSNSGSAYDTFIEGNYIGTDITGNADRGNGTGVAVGSAPGTRIGGTAAGARNVISGNNTGVNIQNTANVPVQGNYIGLRAAGNIPLGNSVGISLTTNALNNVIGGTAAGTGNVIAANVIGIDIDDGASGNLVQGNTVGLSALGSPTGNSTGISVHGAATNNSIGGSVAGARNVITGNVTGVLIFDSGTTGNLVQGNYIGIDQGGTTAFGNVTRGVFVFGSASGNTIGGPGAGNVISGNAVGVHLATSASGNMVQGNIIGLDPSGSAMLGNLNQGILVSQGANLNVIGGASPAMRNIISGNGQGIVIADPGTISNQIQGNYIGTDSSGAIALPNADRGVVIHSGANVTLVGGSNPGEGNVIGGHPNGNIWLDGVNNTTIRGNLIGVNAAGTAGFFATQQFGINVVGAATNTVIGGTTPNERNVISGNQRAIQLLGAIQTGITGNFLGTTADGFGSIGNSGYGVFAEGAQFTIIGGSTLAEGNVISANNTAVHILSADGETSTNNILQRNYIGTASDGVTPLGNGAGVILQANSGGTLTGSLMNLNTIAFNTSPGVVIMGVGATNNQLLTNSIFGNTDIGIDLGGDGITANDAPPDADTGPNNLQNYPVLTMSTMTGEILGTLDSALSTTYRIQFFSNEDGTNDGAVFLTEISVTTDGAGHADIPPMSLSGEWITATATDPDGNTSEFSAPVHNNF